MEDGVLAKLTQSDSCWSWAAQRRTQKPKSRGLVNRVPGAHVEFVRRDSISIAASPVSVGSAPTFFLTQSVLQWTASYLLILVWKHT